MGPQRILLPINVAKCPPGVFELVNQVAEKSHATVTLLRVITLNVTAVENRVYDELSREAQWYLQQLARQYLAPGITGLTRVRLGKVTEQIIAQARAEPSDLIILPVHRPKRKGLERGPRSSATVSSLARTLVRNAPCDVMSVPVSDYFNCEKKWGKPNSKDQMFSNCMRLLNIFYSEGQYCLDLFRLGRIWNDSCCLVSQIESIEEI